MELAPSQYLERVLTAVSHEIDASGGAHVMMGLIRSGGQPHIFITGNVKGADRKDMYLALADKLREMAHNPTNLSLVTA